MVWESIAGGYMSACICSPFWAVTDGEYMEQRALKKRVTSSWWEHAGADSSLEWQEFRQFSLQSCIFHGAFTEQDLQICIPWSAGSCMHSTTK